MERKEMMATRDILNQAQDTMTVKRVVGEPIVQDGVIIVPVAMIVGGAGAGGGRSDQPGKEGEGSGGGFGLVARPVGAYVIKGDTVTWQPALDATCIAIGGQVVAVALFITIRAIVRILARRRAAAP